METKKQKLVADESFDDDLNLLFDSFPFQIDDYLMNLDDLYRPKIKVDEISHVQSLFDDVVWRFDGLPPTGKHIDCLFGDNQGFISTLKLPSKSKKTIYVIDCCRKFKSVLDVLKFSSRFYTRNQKTLRYHCFNGFFIDRHTNTWTMKVIRKSAVVKKTVN